MARVVMAYIVMAYVVMAPVDSVLSMLQPIRGQNHVVMADIYMAHIVMTYILMKLPVVEAAVDAPADQRP